LCWPYDQLGDVRREERTNDTATSRILWREYAWVCRTFSLSRFGGRLPSGYIITVNPRSIIVRRINHGTQRVKGVVGTKYFLNQVAVISVLACVSSRMFWVLELSTSNHVSICGT
jgi:hypothetical protein